MDFFDAIIFNVHPVKIILTDEGGRMCLNDIHIYAILEPIRSHGITKIPKK